MEGAHYALNTGRRASRFAYAPGVMRNFDVFPEPAHCFGYGKPLQLADAATAA